MIVSVIITLIIVYFSKKSNPHKADQQFKKWQLFSSALFSLGHGLNDAQKVMGIIGAAVIYYHVNMIGGTDVYATMESANRFNHFTTDYIWVPLVSFLAIGLGTMSGGWKIVKTMGTRITKVTPLEGVSAETAGAITLFLTDHLGIPVIYYTHHYRFYYWCRTYQKSFCSKMGSYHQFTLGMGNYYSYQCSYCRLYRAILV